MIGIWASRGDLCVVGPAGDEGEVGLVTSVMRPARRAPARPDPAFRSKMRLSARLRPGNGKKHAETQEACRNRPASGDFPPPPALTVLPQPLPEAREADEVLGGAVCASHPNLGDVSAHAGMTRGPT